MHSHARTNKEKSERSNPYKETLVKNESPIQSSLAPHTAEFSPSRVEILTSSFSDS